MCCVVRNRGLTLLLFHLGGRLRNDSCFSVPANHGLALPDDAGMGQVRSVVAPGQPPRAHGHPSRYEIIRFKDCSVGTESPYRIPAIDGGAYCVLLLPRPGLPATTTLDSTLPPNPAPAVLLTHILRPMRHIAQFVSWTPF